MRSIKSILVFSFFILFFVILGLAGFQAYKIFANTGKVSYASQPFFRNVPQAKLKILFLGDSTAVGTGAVSNRESTAGWFGQDFPLASIDNVSANGKRLADLVKDFFPAQNQYYDLVVLQIGANDILKFTSFDSVESSLSTVIERAKKSGKQVVILHSGNVGLAPTFSWPLSWIYTERARTMRALYIKKAKEENILYVDLFAERENDLFLKNISLYYSADGLHPSGEGYHWWYRSIRRTLNQAHVVL